MTMGFVGWKMGSSLSWPPYSSDYVTDIVLVFETITEPMGTGLKEPRTVSNSRKRRGKTHGQCVVPCLLFEVANSHSCLF